MRKILVIVGSGIKKMEILISWQMQWRSGKKAY